MQTSPQNINIQQVKSTEELRKIMQEVLACAHEQGASDASVTVNRDQGFSVNVRMGEVETVEFSEDKEMSVTVYFDKRKGHASSTDTSSASIRAMVTAACDIARVSAADPCFGLADADLINNCYPELDLCHPWDITPPKAIEMALACERHALAQDKRIVNTDGVSLSSYNFTHGYADTHDAGGVLYGTRHSMSCSLIAQEGDAMQRDYDYTTARHFKDLLALDLLAERAAERTISRLNARKIKTQKVPVLFSSRLSGGLFSAFVSAISGSNLYRKNSFLLDSLGEQIFPEYVQIYEQPHLLRALGSAPFDGEGVPTRNNVFVKEGKLCQYVLGSYSARKLGLKTTANSGGVFNLTIDPTHGGFQELLQLLGTGLLVTELMGHGINILTGDYSRGAAGFWVENGEIQYPVEEITIAGNLKNMFRNMVAVGDDLNPNSATRCGSVLIEQMTVAGN
ncbi:metalloprotease PmbA [Legionella septentrionalis]|uniref:Metalloprotease PmbA n=1 Tax=Legionella septentrionalis TaxID=2498109 RepID=A0A433JKN0_9GAMM|nr:metalloprotease PmbA [Legionella septentrionalis]RUQ89052.1 metalloprotease PmbA [Legionella septentrionalis]